MVLRGKYLEVGSCWEWVGFRNPAGYGVVRKSDGLGWPVGEKLAHRLAWSEANGSVPAGLYVCHRCDNPPCVRPEHLFVGTAADNVRDMMTKGRKPRHRERGRLCPQGHDEWRVTPKGWRVCRACRRESERLDRVKARRKRECERERAGVVPVKKPERVTCRKGHNDWTVVGGMRRCVTCHAWRSRLYRAGVRAKTGRGK